MSYATKILILTFMGAVLLAATYLYIQDLLYIKVTGRPGSDRVREWKARRYRPLTRPRYVAYSVVLVLATLLSAYAAGWSGDYKGRGKVFPLVRMLYAACLLYYLRKRWRKQQSDLDDQPSGGAR